MHIYFHKDFKKAYTKLLPKIRKQVDERVLLFAREPFNILLNNHALKGKYAGFRSINISGDYRAVYKMRDGNSANFHQLGTHSQIYKD